MTRPEISVVVPTFRRSDRLTGLITALERQTMPRDRFEIVLVDDGSADETAQVLEDLAARSSLDVHALVLTANRGPAGARNAGWRAAEGDVVAFTDDDCVPQPGWLEWGAKSLKSDPRVGVVQGRTIKPPGERPKSRWTTYREVLGPSPWFEGCNVFYRRAALEQTGGFDEDLGFGGEDTALGWAVLAAGWLREFEQEAVIEHGLSERGLAWHVAQAWQEGRIVALARRFPALRTALWRPWAVRPWNVAFAVGAAGTVVAVRKPIGLVAWLPWVWLRRPPRRFHPWLRYLGEKWAVDAAAFASMKVAAVRHRTFIL